MLLVPMPTDLPFAANEGARLQKTLSAAGLETCIPFHDGKSHHIRIASYAYNRPADFAKLSAAVTALRKNTP